MDESCLWLFLLCSNFPPSVRHLHPDLLGPLHNLCPFLPLIASVLWNWRCGRSLRKMIGCSSTAHPDPWCSWPRTFWVRWGGGTWFFCRSHSRFWAFSYYLWTCASSCYRYLDQGRLTMGSPPAFGDASSVEVGLESSELQSSLFHNFLPQQRGWFHHNH